MSDFSRKRHSELYNIIRIHLLLNSSSNRLLLQNERYSSNFAKNGMERTFCITCGTSDVSPSYDIDAQITNFFAAEKKMCRPIDLLDLL